MSWSPDHERCVDCGSAERKHMGHGLCTRCYSRRRRSGTRPSHGATWSRRHASCVSCGGIEREHHAEGFCTTCYAARRRQTEAGHAAAIEAQRKYAASQRGLTVRGSWYRRWLSMPGSEEKNRRWSRLVRDRAHGAAVGIPLGREGLVFDVFGRRCAACGAEGRLVLDHHHPLEDGHSLLHNAVPLCMRCNTRKGCRDPEDFYDGWKLAEITMLLWETRVEFEHRFGEAAA